MPQLHTSENPQKSKAWWKLSIYVPFPSSSLHYYPAGNPHRGSLGWGERPPGACSGSGSSFVIFPCWQLHITPPLHGFFDVKPGMKLTQPSLTAKCYLFSSLIAGCLFLWSLRQLNISRPLLLCQIRVKSASKFICYSQGLRHTGTAENSAKTTPTDRLFSYGCN